ncbi:MULTISPECIES: AtpZ/AtpI family protein [unclassified Sphingomonas]|uniref:AtpZ/AtpI family protein n=1 Tax=Sphingomonas sp. NIBR02145 TaxID=3014784 RepID=UPI0022B3772F|nr:AtpZ/AtpI family protein [Sphingomonas sp. NIBR02145]WHU05169.1 AtpZ/AtpI family protein [Sphingomonas sp. NIBR02145]
MTQDRAPSDLDRRIADAKAAEAARTGEVVKAPADAKGYKQGSRVLMDLIGMPLGGGILGYALDHWLGTSPWLLLTLLVLSIAAAFRNIYKISKERVE